MTMTPSWLTDGSAIEDPLGHGERAVAWLRRLKHPKNPMKGRPFQLDDWQERIVRRIYGPRDVRGQRIVRRVCLLLPRGNRKTSLCSALTLLHLAGPESMPGGLIVSAASAHEQARELFGEAALIVENDPRLGEHLDVTDYTSTIHFRKKRSRYVALSADGKVQHGRTPQVVIADELHVWEGSAGRKLWEALDSALVKVAGTLLIVATTAGRGHENIAWPFVEYAMKVQRGEIDDPATLPVIFAADAEADWRDEALWYRVNPGLRHGYPDVTAFRDKAKKAEHVPSDRDAFLQYNLNVWLDHSAAPFVEMSIYDEGKAPVDLEAMRDRPCYLAVDLSTTQDLSTIVATWPDGADGFDVWAWFFCPKDRLRLRADRDNVPYPRWVDEGFLTPTPGNVVDLRAVEAKVREICDEHDVREIAFDPHLARTMMSDLAEDGFPAVEMRQGWVTMAPAVMALERAVVGRRFRHGGHPLLRWCFENVAVETDKAGNRMFHKGRSRDRIDGAVAAAMAVGRASVGESGVSVYATERPEGLIFL